MQPGSGLYANVESRDGRVIWQSPSMQGVNIAFQHLPNQVSDRFYRLHSADNRLFVGSMQFTWLTSDERETIYVFNLAKSEAAYWQQVEEFRESLMLWLGGLLILLLVLQFLLLQWGFLPLGYLARSLRAIQDGKQDELKGKFPTELVPITENLNHLIRHERKRQTQYRNALGDLAHSLKTPLAVINSSVETAKTLEDLKPVLEEQVAQLDSMISYQLKRASQQTKNVFSPAVALLPLITKISNAMQKVYCNKNVQLEIDVKPEKMSFNAEEGDLYELLGNLIENAFKYCDHQVKIKGKLTTHAVKPGLHITISNDGATIKAHEIEQVLERGGRTRSADVPGQGIGLAVVNDLVICFGGELHIHESSLGGTRIEIWLPK
jgi:two-component system sensor histidine kinase PhoQ